MHIRVVQKYTVKLTFCHLPELQKMDNNETRIFYFEIGKIIVRPAEVLKFSMHFTWGKYIFFVYLLNTSHHEASHL